MSTQTTPNAQTPGPLTVKGPDLWAADSPGKPARAVAQVAGPNRSDRLAEREANRRLLAAGFNAFDRAGRELGVDAAELAERLDLVALIRAALNVESFAKSRAKTEEQKECVGWLTAALAPLSTLTAEPTPRAGAKGGCTP